jgi:Putative 2OG-Fe(II) oxygenase
MAAKVEVQPGVIWPTVLYTAVWREQGAEAAAIVAELYRQKAALAANIASGIATAAKSRQGLFEGAFDLLESPHPGLAKLKAFIEEALRLAIAHVNGGQHEPQRIRPVVTESWFHITNDGGFHDAHYHNQCSWCGIYYLQAGECTPTDERGPGNGVNRFYCPLPSGGGYIDYGNNYLTSNRADIVPQDGMLVLFPSYLLHSALAYRGQQDRIAISFNAQATLGE